MAYNGWGNSGGYSGYSGWSDYNCNNQADVKAAVADLRSFAAFANNEDADMSDMSDMLSNLLIDDSADGLDLSFDVSLYDAEAKLDLSFAEAGAGTSLTHRFNGDIEIQGIEIDITGSAILDDTGNLDWDVDFIMNDTAKVLTASVNLDAVEDLFANALDSLDLPADFTDLSAADLADNVNMLISDLGGLDNNPLDFAGSDMPFDFSDFF